MILSSILFIWFGWAVLYTLALCQAASVPMPKPNPWGRDRQHDLGETSPDEQGAAGNALP